MCVCVWGGGGGGGGGGGKGGGNSNFVPLIFLIFVTPMFGCPTEMINACPKIRSRERERERESFIEIDCTCPALSSRLFHKPPQKYIWGDNRGLLMLCIMHNYVLYPRQKYNFSLKYVFMFPVCLQLLSESCPIYTISALSNMQVHVENLSISKNFNKRLRVCI